MMLTIISPAKTLDFDHALPPKSDPKFIKEATTLIEILSTYDEDQLSKLMRLSPKLSQLNHARYKAWSPQGEKAALMVFKGEVYRGIDPDTLSRDALRRAERSVFILSGLYGLLRSFDGVCPHRLEMGTRLKTKAHHNLYDFWGDKITIALNKTIQASGTEFLLNLASKEYFKSVQARSLNAKIITPIFQDEKGGTYKVISVFAKKARGLMVRYILEEGVEDLSGLCRFNLNGYSYDRAGSTALSPLFKRAQQH